jgi:beta-1,4-mannosyl-glycoprotein beta-1,4-N-acetylglucosaminyltransferase
MKIYDVISFYQELDLLELRMSILDKHVDYFVVNEAPFTFSGKEKPLYFLENKDKFKQFESKIIHHVCKENDKDWENWERSLVQKGSAIEELVRDFELDDIIIHSDADEIPNLEKADFEKVIASNKMVLFQQFCYYYYLNTICVSNKQVIPWQGTRLASWKLFRRCSINELRGIDDAFIRHSPNQIIRPPESGWHFSYLGGTEAMKQKIGAYEHQELNIPVVLDNLQKNLDELKDPFFREGSEIVQIPMTPRTHPQYLLDNLEKYRHLIRGA